MSDKEQCRAAVTSVNGRPVLHDPEALAVINAVERYNCRPLLEANRDRVKHFARRAPELGKSSDEVVIVIANVDDPNGGLLADALMPGYDWDSIRARGELPVARGLAGREGVQGFLNLIDAEAAGDLLLSEGLAVVVVDRGVAAVFKAGEVS